MARLIVNPGLPSAWEIPLRPGINSIGRGAANSFVVTDPSISTSHCQIELRDDSAIIRDLGSTNGTYLNRAKINESALQAGNTVHLGGVEMLFHSDSQAPVIAMPPPPGPLRPAIAVARPTMRVAVPTAAPARNLAETPIEEEAPTPPVSQNCKFHPKTPGRLFCNHCNHFFCELCVTSRSTGGVPKKFCRHCGAECTAVQVHITRPVTKGFFAQVPGVFVYPFRGSGFLVLIVATMLFAALERMSGIASILITIAAVGYLFSFMQTIIHSTAAEDNEMPGLPGMDDLFMGCFRLLGCVLISFGIAIGLACLGYFKEEMRDTAYMGAIAGVVFGCIYFPMALLAVAMKDSVAAANPLVVMPAIFKAPLEYLVTVVLLGAVFGIRVLGGVVVTMLSMDTYTTRDMSKLLLTLGLSAFWSFISVYLLTVNMRLLGLLYVTKKDKLGWFRR
jgi:hypothetical protein